VRCVDVTVGAEASDAAKDSRTGESFCAQALEESRFQRAMSPSIRLAEKNADHYLLTR